MVAAPVPFTALDGAHYKGDAVDIVARVDLDGHLPSRIPADHRDVPGGRGAHRRHRGARVRGRRGGDLRLGHPSACCRSTPGVEAARRSPVGRARHPSYRDGAGGSLEGFVRIP